MLSMRALCVVLFTVNILMKNIKQLNMYQLKRKIQTITPQKPELTENNRKFVSEYCVYVCV